jgi:hypothetical protein
MQIDLDAVIVVASFAGLGSAKAHLSRFWCFCDTSAGRVAHSDMSFRHCYAATSSYENRGARASTIQQCVFVHVARLSDCLIRELDEQRVRV